MVPGVFFRAFRAAEFDICELSLSSYAIKMAQGDCPYIAVPAFVSRAFRHNAVFVRTDRIKKPADLKGKKVGVPEYQLTANVWARAFLDDDYGVTPADIHWIRGGIAQPGRSEKLTIELPAGVRLDNAPEGVTISALLQAGEIDGFIATPAKPHRERPFAYRLAVSRPGPGSQGLLQAHRLFSDHARAEHPPCLGRAAPLAPRAVLKAFEQAKQLAVAGLADTTAAKVTLPFVEEMLRDARALMGEDFWSYGVAPNRKVLDYFLGQHHAQGLSSRRLSVDELFHPATYETFRCERLENHEPCRKRAKSLIPA